MVDFNALMGKTKRDGTIDPLAIFEELPKKGAVHDLYQVQAEILRKWFEGRSEYEDVVIELNTGGGKTLVGLLIALSTARETRKGTLYLVENKQLARQVVDQAAQIGIPAKAYEGRASLDADFDNGDAVLVGAYQALFNGRSVFGVKGSAAKRARLGGVVIDDAHASLDALRGAFTLVVPADEEVVYRKVLAEFKDAFDALGRSHSYEELYEGVGNHVVEIPYEYWRKAENGVFSILLNEERARESSKDDFSQSLRFNWPLIKDNLRYCQVVVSRERVSIAAMYPLLHMIPSFGEAERRVYMSATITDYGDMVRSYDLRSLEEAAIIAPKTVSGVGRRMVLFPPTEHVASDEFRELVKKELKARHGVVRLASESGSELVKQLSCIEPMGNEEVTQAVESLRAGSLPWPVSFVNRYNGIDLPSDACRVLILENLPVGANDIDSVLSSYLPDSDVVAQRIAQKIEQGMGRGVRGASDHCVVLVTGSRLIDWMKREKNKQFFSPPLQAQIRMGEKITADIESPADLCEAMGQEIASEDSWVEYHALCLARDMPEPPNRFGRTFNAACVERRAFSLWIEGKPGKAVEFIRKKLGDFADDAPYQGWLLSIASRMAYDGGSLDISTECAAGAHSLNRLIECVESPEEASVPDWAITQARGIAEKLRSEKGVSVLAGFDREMASLTFGAPSKEFEVSLCALGSYLGFEASRKDQNGEGPDVCWVDPLHKVGWAIEAKNEKESDSSLHKAEAGQLRTARDWMSQNYPGIGVEAVSVHPSAIADSNASASNLKVLTPASLEGLRRNVRSLLDEIGGFAGVGSEVDIARAIVSRRLGLKDLAADCLVPFEANGGLGAS